MTAGNAVRGLAVIVDGSGNIVFSDDPDHLVALVGVRDSVVVHTPDVTMVCPVADAEGVKRLLAAVEERLPGVATVEPCGRGWAHGHAGDATESPAIATSVSSHRTEPVAEVNSSNERTARDRWPRSSRG